MRFFRLAPLLLCASAAGLSTGCNALRWLADPPGRDGGLAISIPGQAPYDHWTWISVPESTCAGGSTTGMGINPHPGSAGLLIFLAGGGMCWDYDTCVAHPTAEALNGFSELDFDAAAGIAGSAGIFNRADPANPFANFDFAFIPYCTGDLHAGNAVANYQGVVIRHVGYLNLQAFLRHLVPTFSQEAQIALAGSSAGGFGAVWNYGTVRATFGAISPVTRFLLIDDSGPYLRPRYLTTALEQVTAAAWNAASTLPPACSDCMPGTTTDSGFHRLLPYYAYTDPDLRASLISSTQDATIRAFFALPPGNPAMAGCDLSVDGGCPFEEGLADFEANLAQASAPGRVRVYYVPGAQHGWLLDPVEQVQVQNTTLGDFFTRQLAGSASWQDVQP